MQAPQEQVYFAHKHWVERKSRFFYFHASPSEFFVKNHGDRDPMVRVRIRERLETDPPCLYWGWLGTNRPDRFVYIWPSECQVDINFPYGSKTESDLGRGRIVQLVIEEIPDPV